MIFLSGDLLVFLGNESRWWRRRVMVRGGQLLVGSSLADGTSGGMRVPLRHLSLGAGPVTNSLALFRGQNVILTLQVSNPFSFENYFTTLCGRDKAKTANHSLCCNNCASCAHILEKKAPIPSHNRESFLPIHYPAIMITRSFTNNNRL